MFQLNHRRAVISGAASGIGLAIARRFSEAEAEVLLCDREHDAVQARAAEIAAGTGSPVKSFAFDVSDEAAVGQAFAQIGPIDILVNCAGVAHVGTLATTCPADVDRLFQVNVRGTYLCMRASLPSLLRQPGGCILNMASIAATAGIPDRFAYSMTKGAVVAMTLSVARDYVAHGLRCNCISPARIHTPFVDGFVAKNYPGHEQEKLKELAAAQPVGRMGTPEEVATLALYLCSPEAGFLTGVDYALDGGFFNLR
ncbi:SDR family oxidoreductase [Acidipila sp. EB88]|nr:SDR family oxidoreductase [Acidipila sp. EB88]RRA47143.1 SDR family oxidoreductase [Acidipila sp. EB88]